MRLFIFESYNILWRLSNVINTSISFHKKLGLRVDQAFCGIKLILGYDIIEQSIKIAFDQSMTFHKVLPE